MVIMIIHDLKKKQYPHVPGKLPSLRDILADRPPVPRALLLRQGRQAGGEPADEVGLLRGGIHPDIVLLRSAPRGFTAIPGWENGRTPRLAASLARSKNLHSRNGARAGTRMSLVTGEAQTAQRPRARATALPQPVQRVVCRHGVP